MEADCNQQKTVGNRAVETWFDLWGAGRMSADGTWTIRGCTTRRFGRLSGGKTGAGMGGNTARTSYNFTAQKRG